MSGKAEQRQIKIANATIEELRGEIICDRCGAHVDTMADVCMAEMDERCPGFNRYDEVRCKYQRAFKP